LAEAVGLPFAIKQVRAEGIWTTLPAQLFAGTFGRFVTGGDPLLPPWPDLVIACGRPTISAARAIKRASGGRAFTVYLQHPHMPTGWFDLIVPPRHDRLTGRNVIPTRGAIHHVTPEAIAGGATRLAPTVAHLPRPLVAVLIGGPSRDYQFGAAEASRIGDDLAALAKTYGAGLMITASRRTGPDSVKLIRERLAGTPHWFWDGSGENPYVGMLGLADTILVTADSVAMTSEACSTGKPVYVISLPGERGKFKAFHDALRADGAARRFEGRLESYTYAPLDDTRHVAEELLRRFAETR
jgi:hypothetical protein